MHVKDQFYTPAALTTGKKSGTHGIEMGFRAELDPMAKKTPFIPAGNRSPVKQEPQSLYRLYLLS
jgi:hypothetical protein